MSGQIFEVEAFARNGFTVRHAYVDLTGDLIAGILLGQIVYWYLPNEQGKSKLKVKKNGAFWLAKSREDWGSEIRITPKQYDRAIKILIEKRFVNVQTFKFNGAPTHHIQLNIPEINQRVKSILTFGKISNASLDEMELTERGNSLTKITTKTTTEITTGKDTIPYEEIILYLNEKANKSFKHQTPKNRTLIKARWQEGFILSDFQKVIDQKTVQWLTDARMKQYIRPETLFGTKFESYLNEEPVNHSDGPNGGGTNHAITRKDNRFIEAYDF
ncbi:conserved phage C-terminal domain-containing protein [Bacillus cereus]|uniref:conserved phage C-terminal domain-containing protein n=1 Tax=Bacillus cereus TaxID=1396 RepID=UPI0021125A58|nr:conserved phage C-terminal domain-containing protein [Bacillus cereus]